MLKLNGLVYRNFYPKNIYNFYKRVVNHYWYKTLKNLLLSTGIIHCKAFD